MHKIFGLAAAALLSGCVSVGVAKAPDGTIALSTGSNSLGNNYSGAQIALDYRARDVCPSGYRKLDERTERQGADDILVWNLKCL